MSPTSPDPLGTIVPGGGGFRCIEAVSSRVDGVACARVKKN